MQTPHLAIFDLDGTLVATGADIVRAMQRVMAARHLPVPTPDEVMEAVGWGAQTLVAKLLGPTRAALVERVLEAFRVAYREELVVASRPYPGVPALLDALAERGCRSAVLTNKPAALARELLDRLDLARRLERALGPEDVPTKKPAPDGIDLLRAELGVAADRTVMVGDLAPDIDAARAAGVRSILVTYGEFLRPAALAQRADYVASTVGALRGLLLG